MLGMLKSPHGVDDGLHRRDGAGYALSYGAFWTGGTRDSN